MKLTDFKALTFDVYGTLIDWETGIMNGLKPLTDKVSRTMSRNDILETHAHYESAAQTQTPAKIFSDILAVVYKRLAEEWGVKVTWEECLTYGASVEHWPAFNDSAEALAYLRDHFKLIVLSNVDNASFVYSDRKLGSPFHAVYTAGDIGSYKPSSSNFDYMLANLERLDIAKQDILHTAESMFHDHVPANAFGLANCWIYRRHNQEGFGATPHPGAMPAYDFVFNSMAELVEAHKAETGFS